MRILVAPDKFAGTLTAVEAAEAIAAGWRETAPDDELDLAPMSDGGPGFVDVLHEALGGELLAVTVRGPHGAPTPATVLVVGDTAYVESAQACGLHLTGERGRRGGHDVRRRRAGGRRGRRRCHHRRGRARRQWHQRRRRRAARRAGRHRRRTPRRRRRRRSTASPRSTCRRRSRPGRLGAAGRGQRRGQPADRAVRRDQDLRPAEGDHRGAAAGGGRVARAVRRGAGPPAWPSRRAPGRRAGSATRCSCSAPPGEPGIALVADAVGLADRAGAADLVVTGEGAFDYSSRAGKVPHGVAQVAEEALRPCVVLAGKVLDRLPGDAGAGDRVGVLAGRPGGGGAGVRRAGRRPRRARGPDRAHLVALSGSALRRVGEQRR